MKSNLSNAIKYGLVALLLVATATPMTAIHTTPTEKSSKRAFYPKHLSGFQKSILKRVAKRIRKKLAKTTDQQQGRKPEILSVLGFSSSLFGLLIVLSSGAIGLAFLGLGLFLSLIGLIRISAHPKRHAKVSFLFAILGLLIGGGVAIALAGSVG